MALNEFDKLERRLADQENNKDSRCANHPQTCCILIHTFLVWLNTCRFDAYIIGTDVCLTV